MEKTWGMKTTTVPVIIGAFGLIKKGTENYIGKIPGNNYKNNRATEDCPPWNCSHT